MCSFFFFLTIESDVIPNLLQQETELDQLRTAPQQTLTLPCVLHYDAYAGETGMQLWALDPPNFNLYGAKKCSTPQITSGWTGKEGKLKLYAQFIFCLLFNAFREAYRLPAIPHIVFTFVLSYVVCMFGF